MCLLGAGALGRRSRWSEQQAGRCEERGMARRPVGLVYDERMCKHKSKDPNHHERPERVTTIYQVLKDAGVPQR